MILLSCGKLHAERPANFLCAVGANGSGKSNFFHGKTALNWPGMSTAMSSVMAVNLCLSDAAVRFVLNDIFSGLRADDRQKLLHVSSPSWYGYCGFCRKTRPYKQDSLSQHVVFQL